MKLPTESQEQQELAEWLDDAGVTWCHVPNGAVFFSGAGGRDGRRFAKLKRLRREGVKPGVVDAHVFTPPPARPHRRGAALELKRQRGPKGGTAHCAEFTDDEKAWLRRLDAEGWEVPKADGDVIALYGAAEAIEWLRGLGYGGAT